MTSRWHFVLKSAVCVGLSRLTGYLWLAFGDNYAKTNEDSPTILTTKIWANTHETRDSITLISYSEHCADICRNSLERTRQTAFACTRLLSRYSDQPIVWREKIPNEKAKFSRTALLWNEMHAADALLSKRQLSFLFSSLHSRLSQTHAYSIIDWVPCRPGCKAYATVLLASIAPLAEASSFCTVYTSVGS